MKLFVGLATFFALLYFMAEFWPLVIAALVIGGLKSRRRR